MITMSQLNDYVSQVSGLPRDLFFPGPRQPDLPTPMVITTWAGGPGLGDEGVMDRVSFQVLTVGEQADYAGGEDMAWRVDNGLLSGPRPFSIAADRITRLWRVGGRPSALEVDDADRQIFTCNYILELSSGLVLS